MQGEVQLICIDSFVLRDNCVLLCWVLLWALDVKFMKRSLSY